MLIFPDPVKSLGPDDLPATLIQLLPVLVGPGVGSSLILGVHPDRRRILATKCIWIQAFLQSFLSQLGFLSFLQLLELVILSDFPLFVIIFVRLQLNDNFEKFLNLGFQFIRVHGLQVKRFNSMLRAIFFSSSSCSLVLVISL